MLMSTLQYNINIFCSTQKQSDPVQSLYIGVSVLGGKKKNHTHKKQCCVRSLNAAYFRFPVNEMTVSDEPTKRKHIQSLDYLL